MIHRDRDPPVLNPLPPPLPPPPPVYHCYVHAGRNRSPVKLTLILEKSSDRVAQTLISTYLDLVFQRVQSLVDISESQGLSTNSRRPRPSVKSNRHAKSNRKLAGYVHPAGRNIASIKVSQTPERSKDRGLRKL